jgi:predicted nuclease of predicted toxin-antitoxin system
LELLPDENISPSIVGRLAELGVYAQSVPHVGLSGQPDHVVWAYAHEHGSAVVTINAQDFIELLDVDLHPGLIILRESGLNREEQWMRIQPVVQHVLASGDENYMLNKVIEITAAGEFEIRDVPPLK